MKEFILNNLLEFFVEYLVDVIEDEFKYSAIVDFYSFIKSKFCNIIDSLEVHD